MKSTMLLLVPFLFLGFCSKEEIVVEETPVDHREKIIGDYLCQKNWSNWDWDGFSSGGSSIEVVRVRMGQDPDGILLLDFTARVDQNYHVIEDPGHPARTSILEFFPDMDSISFYYTVGGNSYGTNYGYYGRKID